MTPTLVLYLPGVVSVTRKYIGRGNPVEPVVSYQHGRHAFSTTPVNTKALSGLAWMNLVLPWPIRTLSKSRSSCESSTSGEVTLALRITVVCGPFFTFIGSSKDRIPCGNPFLSGGRSPINRPRYCFWYFPVSGIRYSNSL